MLSVKCTHGNVVDGALFGICKALIVARTIDMVWSIVNESTAEVIWNSSISISVYDTFCIMCMVYKSVNMVE